MDWCSAVFFPCIALSHPTGIFSSRVEQLRLPTRFLLSCGICQSLSLSLWKKQRSRRLGYASPSFFVSSADEVGLLIIPLWEDISAPS